MKRPTYGLLTNPQAWQDKLNPHPYLFDALGAWIRGKPFNLTLRRWLSGGNSGSYVAVVRLHPDGGTLRDRILKLIPPDLAEAESRSVGLAHQRSPQAFSDRHLVKTEDAVPLAKGWWLHLQEVAQGDLSTLAPLADLIDDPAFGDYCHVILTSLVTEWNGGDDPPPEVCTPADFLREALRNQLPPTGGLCEFAQKVGLNADRPDPHVAIPGRPGELPNPLALVRGVVGQEQGKVEIFLGNGHGDLHLHNVLVPIEPNVDPAAYQLIDLGRFSHEMPVSRDPMKLLLATAAEWLPSLAARSAIRSSLAEMVVAPRSYPPVAAVLGYRTVVNRIHAAAKSWADARQVGHDWHRQNLVVLIATALRFAARTDFTLTDRWWFYEVAALATRAFLQPDQHRYVPPTLPTMRPVSPLIDAASPASLPTQSRESTKPERISRPTSGRPNYSGTTKLAACRRLGDDWRDLADVLQIRTYERNRFPRGDEPRQIWEWLEQRNRLQDLRDALLLINRQDLVQILDDET